MFMYVIWMQTYMPSISSYDLWFFDPFDLFITYFVIKIIHGQPFFFLIQRNPMIECGTWSTIKEYNYDIRLRWEKFRFSHLRIALEKIIVSNIFPWLLLPLHSVNHPTRMDLQFSNDNFFFTYFLKLFRLRYYQTLNINTF